MKKIAVILCGSGYRDGSEIRESVGALWALSRHPVEIQCFAPDADQADVFNCLTDQPVAHEKRNMLVEAARIARGEIQPLTELQPRDFAGIIIPGGFGAAKNLCTFAFQGSGGTVRPELASALKEFHSTGKPIGAICIAPAILALTFKGQGFELTAGAPCEAAQEYEKLGHKHVPTRANEAHTDTKNRVVTTPAYMLEAPLHEIFTGIERLMSEVIRMT